MGSDWDQELEKRVKKMGGQIFTIDKIREKRAEKEKNRVWGQIFGVWGQIFTIDKT